MCIVSMMTLINVTVCHNSLDINDVNDVMVSMILLTVLLFLLVLIPYMCDVCVFPVLGFLC
jgi:hypothetical protein